MTLSKTIRRKTALLALLGLTALALLPGPARAQVNPDVRRWQGFSWNAGTHNPPGYQPADSQLLVGRTLPSGFVGSLFLGGAWHTVVARTAADGSVDLTESGVARPLHLVGSATPTGGGTTRLLLHFQTADGATSFVELLGLIPPDPYTVAVPPDPYFEGSFQSRTGFSGRLSLTFEHNPPDDRPAAYTGKLTRGDRTYSFVATVGARANAEGRFAFDLIGVSPDAAAPLVHVTGSFSPSEIAPCVRVIPGSIRGTYESLALLPAVRVADRGTLDVTTL